MEQWQDSKIVKCGLFTANFVRKKCWPGIILFQNTSQYQLNLFTFRQKIVYFVSSYWKLHNLYCHKARDNAWQIRWYTKYRSRKRKKKITKGAHLQTPPIGQKNYHPLSEVFLTPYLHCILEVVELKEQLAKPGVSINNFYSTTYAVGNFCGLLLFTLFCSNFAVGNFCVATFLSRLLNITH